MLLRLKRVQLRLEEAWQALSALDQWQERSEVGRRARAGIGNCRAIGKNQRTCGMVSDAEVCVEDDAMAPFSNCVYSCGTQLNENEDAILLANFMQHPVVLHHAPCCFCRGKWCQSNPSRSEAAAPSHVTFDIQFADLHSGKNSYMGHSLQALDVAQACGMCCKANANMRLPRKKS
eukprot:1149224-Pelagomonas_calceolata.AAC.2